MVTRLDLPKPHRPVAIFDAGIGSYAAVATLRRTLPLQNIVYFADRASFPYGDKTRPALLRILERTLHLLDGFDPAAVLVASNAPSITVLDDVAGMIAAPVFGVRPPIAKAVRAAKGRDVAVLGVRSLVESPELRAYAAAETGDDIARVHFIDASVLVEMVETGAFLFDIATTQSRVNAFFAALNTRYPALGAITLSSTHLPWLRSYLEAACDGCPLLDPLDDAIAEIVPHGTKGQGLVLGLVTEDERYRVADFQRMLDRLGVTLRMHVVAT